MPKKPFLGQKFQFSVANKCFKRGLVALSAKGQLRFSIVVVSVQ